MKELIDIKWRKPILISKKQVSIKTSEIDRGNDPMANQEDPVYTGNVFKKFMKCLGRKKKIESNTNDALVTQLRRCLSTFDITLLGIASTLGSGVYVLTGEISHKTGPAILISISVAAFASVLCGLCYTEFAARVPKAGSAYVYSYSVIGEFSAFIVGWNLILEYGIGAAAVITSLTQYLDNALLDHRIKDYTVKVIGNHTVLGYELPFDFFSFFLCFLLTFSVGIGVKKTSYLNSFCTGVNIIVIAMFIGMGACYANTKYVTPFAPTGIPTIISGASSCFFAFIGFDAVCMVAEEAKTPSKSVPFAVVTTILICYFGFMGVALVLNMMISYQDMQGSSALATAFTDHGFDFGRYCIAIGAIFGLLGNGITSMMMMPRFLYSMANDGLIFPFFAYVDSKFQIPLISTALSGLLTGGMCLVFDNSKLVEMVSIGTIVAYTLVTLSILVLRYKSENLGLMRARTRSILSGISISQDGRILISPHLLEEVEEEERMHEYLQGICDSTKFEDSEDSSHSRQAKSSTDVACGESHSNCSRETPKHYCPRDTESQIRSSDTSSLINTPCKELDPYEIKTISESDQILTKNHGENIDQNESDVTIYENIKPNESTEGDNDSVTSERLLIDTTLDYSLLASVYGSLKNKYTFPTPLTESVAIICCVLVFVEIIIFSTILHFFTGEIVSGNVFVIIILVLFGVLILITAGVLSKLPENPQRLYFKVPFLPWVPILGLFLNIYLLLGLNRPTWIRFGIWMALGFFIYFGYGICHSHVNKSDQQEEPPVTDQ